MRKTSAAAATNGRKETGAAPASLSEVRRRRSAGSQRYPLFMAIGAVCLAVAAYWLSALGGPDPKQLADAARLISEATVAMHGGDYLKAESLSKRALELSSTHEHLEFYATVVLGLGRLDEAVGYYRKLFKSWKPPGEQTDSLVVLQRYLVCLHRLGLSEELSSVWSAVKDHVPWTSPLQCPDQVDESLLPGRPLHNASDYRATRIIEANLPVVREELDAYNREQERKRQDGAAEMMRGFIPNQDIDLVDGYVRSNWQELLLFEKGAWKEDLCGAGRPFHRTCQPLRGLKEIEGRYRGFKVGQVSILRLEPGTHLVPHFGTVNWRLVANCGVIVPQGVTIDVGGVRTNWTENKCTLFDDSFLHEVWHNGTEPRYTFFANFLIVDSE